MFRRLFSLNDLFLPAAKTKPATEIAVPRPGSGFCVADRALTVGAAAGEANTHHSFTHSMKLI